MTTSRKIACCSQCGCLLPPSGFCARCALELSGFKEQDQFEDLDSSAMAAPGRRAPLFGRFELLSEGEGGGKGTVYKARELVASRVVGLKVMQGRSLRHPGEVQRFQNEVRALANLDHPHILPIYEAGEHHGQHFYTMKWISEGSLGHQLSHWQLKEAPISQRGERQKAIANLLAKVAHAIQFAHERGILHRDLKPGNILVDAQGNPYVADFGMAKFMEQEAESGITMSGDVVGTLVYMSPEQVEGNNRAITVSSDIWALGVILYELLAGCRPFQGAGDLEIQKKISEEEPLKPSSVLAQLLEKSSGHQRVVIDANLETICLKCIEKEPGQRYPSARALAEDLGRWLRGEPILARPAGLTERAWKWIKRHPVQARLSGVIVACVILGAGAVLWQWRKYISQAEITAQVQIMGALQQAEKEFAEDQASTAVARLAGILRQNPSNRLAAERLLNALAVHSFLVPAGHPLPGNVLLACSSPDHRWLALTDTNDAAPTSVFVRELDTGKLVKEYRGSHRLNALAFSPDGSRLAWGSEGQIQVLDLRQPQAGVALPAPNHPIRQLLFLSENQLVVVVDKTASLWRVLPPGEILTWTAPEPLVKVAYSPQAGMLVTADEAGSMQWHHAVSGQLLRTFPADPPCVVRHLGFSRDGSKFVCATAGAVNAAKVWNVSDGTPISALTHGEGVYDADFSPDNRLLATASRDKAARLWDLETSALKAVMRHKDAVNAARFSSTGHYLVTASDDGSVRIWDSATGSPASEPASLMGPVLDVQFIHQDTRLLAWVDGGGIYQLDRTPVQRWLQLAESYGPPPPSRLTQADRVHFASNPAATVSEGDVSLDEKRVVVAAGKRAEIWDRFKHRKIGNSLEHHADVNCARFSPDGRRVVTSTSERQLRVWDALSGMPLTDSITSERSVSSVWFSSDSSVLITENDQIWPLFIITNTMPTWLPGLAESIAGRQFSSSHGLVPLPVNAFAEFKTRLPEISDNNRLGRWISQLRKETMGEFLIWEVSP